MSDLTKQSKLKNCPFCGCSTPVLNPPFADIGFKGSINCPACLAEMPRESDEAELIRCWNTRSASAGVREALESIDAILDAVWSTNDRAEEVDGLVKIKAIIRSALSDHGVQESAAGASTKSDGGVEGHAQRATSAATAPRLAASGMGGIEAPAAGIKPGPSDSLLSKTLTEGEKKRPQIESSPANEGSSLSPDGGASS